MLKPQTNVNFVTLGLLLGCFQTEGISCLAQGASLTPPASLAQNDTKNAPAVPDSRAPLLLYPFLAQVDARYPKLLALEAERQSASAKRLEKQGAFDPVFTIGNNQSAYNDGGKLKSASASEFALEWLSPLGVKLVAGGQLNLGAIKSPLTTTGTSGQYYTGLKLPLLRGLGINEKSAAERQARLGEPLADAAFAQARLELLNKAAADYWDWVAAGRKVKVAQDLLALAQTRADAIGERVEKGDLPGIDGTEALQEVQRRQGALTKAERDHAKAAYKLSLYLWQPDGTPAPLVSGAQVPAAPDAPRPLADKTVQEAAERALTRRPELKNIGLSREISRVDLSLARNQRLPGVDLVFNPGFDTGADSVGNTMKVGVVLTVPLQQRAARGRIADSKLKIEKLTQEEKLQRQRIVIEVQDAASAVNTAQQRHEAATQELLLAQALEQGERDRFALGDSTLFLVNQRERASAEAAVKVIEIYAEYEQAMTAFRAASAAL